MAGIIQISQDQSNLLDRYQKEYGSITTRLSISVAAAAFLFVGALIVIGCGSLCFTLPGVNVINDIVVKAIIPGALAIAISIPCIVESIIQRREQNRKRDEITNAFIEYIEEYEIINLPKSKSKETPGHKEETGQMDFFLLNFLKWERVQKKASDPPNPPEYGWEKNEKWTREYQRKLLAETKEKLEKTYPEADQRSQLQKNLLEAFDDAQGKVYAPAKDLK